MSNTKISESGRKRGHQQKTFAMLSGFGPLTGREGLRESVKKVTSVTKTFFSDNVE